MSIKSLMDFNHLQFLNEKKKHKTKRSPDLTPMDYLLWGPIREIEKRYTYSRSDTCYSDRND